MKAFVAVVAMGLVACVHGQQCADAIAKIPACAVDCINETTEAAGCAADDPACGCRPEVVERVSQEAVACVLSACGIEQGLEAQAAAQEVCACVATLPAADTTPQPETTAAPDVTPAPEESPVPEQSPAPEATPAPEESPVPEQSPAPEATPAPEESPVPEQLPAPEATPAPQESPVPEDQEVPEAAPTAIPSPSPPFPSGPAVSPGQNGAGVTGTAPPISPTQTGNLPIFTGAATELVGSIGGVLGALMVAILAL